MVTEIQLFWFPELDVSASVFPPPSFGKLSPTALPVCLFYKED